MYGSFTPLARRLRQFEVRAVVRQPPQLSALEAMGLWHGDTEEPVSSGIPYVLLTPEMVVTLIKRNFDLMLAGHSVGLFPQLGMPPEAMHRVIECYANGKMAYEQFPMSFKSLHSHRVNLKQLPD